MELKPLVGLTPEFFFTLFNTLVLFLVLRIILFKPVLKIMETRESEIKRDLEEGAKAKEEGLLLKSEYEKKVSEARSEGQAIVEQAKKRAEKRTEEMLAHARKEAENIRNKANVDIEKERQQAFLDVKNEVSDMAVSIASKIIEKDIDNDKHKELIDEFVKEVGDAK